MAVDIWTYHPAQLSPPFYILGQAIQGGDFFVHSWTRAGRWLESGEPHPFDLDTVMTPNGVQPFKGL